ncbi:MAG: cytochrome c biogenesis protein CcdA [Acidobacteria bacterium]|nr:cytochrome c biogenesis protein CcdA [Acidobacteriota bacterium]
MEVSIFAAFLAGVISFLSPCVLPLVPGYISMMTGCSLEQLKEGDAHARILPNAGLFVVGFSLVFIALGASATWAGQLLATRMSLLSKVAGVVIVAFGLHLMGVFRIGLLYRDKRFHSTGAARGPAGSLLLGSAFAFGWTPCIGPILAGILAYAATQETVYQGMFLLAVYSAGLGVPFLLTGFGVDRFLRFYRSFTSYFKAVEVASGVLLIVIGVLIFTNNFTRLASYLTFLNRFAR